MPLKSLGPGLITGAADDDPSGIATYSQAGAQFGTGLLWITVLTVPLMIGIQMISARIGWVTGQGVAANLRQFFPRPLGILIVGLLVVANTFNLGADLAAMSAVLGLLTHGSGYHLGLIGFATLSLGLQIWLPFRKYAPILKILTLSLFTYVGILFSLHIPWMKVIKDTLLPNLHLGHDYWMTIAALLGTTISPYLFFWQASHEAEDREQRCEPHPRYQPVGQSRAHLRRIRLDTYTGMIFSNLIAFFIILTSAVTLHAHGVTDIQTTRQAALALEPIAGRYAYWMYGIGVIGAGLIAVPVLAGSAAYAVAETMSWNSGLNRTPLTARGFYVVIAAATLVGVFLEYSDVDPVKELFWAAVLNGIIAVPIMVALLVVVQRSDIMGSFVARQKLRILGWAATLAMGAVCVGLAWSWLKT